MASTLLLFTVADRRCAIHADRVAEVVRAVAVQPLPAAPPVVEGVVNVRGGVVAVVDLRRRFGLPTRALRPADHFVLTRVSGRHVALRVDGVEGLREADLLPSDTPLEGAFGKVAGLAGTDDGLVVIHDVDAFLSQVEGEALDDALAARKVSA